MLCDSLSNVVTVLLEEGAGGHPETTRGMRTVSASPKLNPAAFSAISIPQIPLASLPMYFGSGTKGVETMVLRATEKLKVNERTSKRSLFAVSKERYGKQ